MVVLRRLDWGSPLDPGRTMAIVFFSEPGTYVTSKKDVYFHMESHSRMFLVHQRSVILKFSCSLNSGPGYSHRGNHDALFPKVLENRALWHWPHFLVGVIA